MNEPTKYQLGPDVAEGEELYDRQGRLIDDAYVHTAVDDAIAHVRGRGRPSLSSSGESPLLRVRLSRELDDAVRRAAERSGASRSEWVRRVLDDAANQAGLLTVPARSRPSHQSSAGELSDTLQGIRIDRKEAVMADKKNVHTVPTEGGWANRREGGQRASSTHNTKAEAQAAGREAAKKDGVEHLIHKKDGTIGERNSYGNDPYPPKG